MDVPGFEHTRELLGYPVHTARELLGYPVHTACELLGYPVHTARELLGYPVHSAHALWVPRSWRHHGKQTVVNCHFIFYFLFCEF